MDAAGESVAATIAFAVGLVIIAGLACVVMLSIGDAVGRAVRRRRYRRRFRRRG